ncbi:MAG: iron-containing alcohol dehydrogenase [Burkholderiales bacterium]|nr:MAG: iron-containing alcohol dehydrogenase [Burkholderiales bacterium]
MPIRPSTGEATGAEAPAALGAPPLQPGGWFDYRSPAARVLLRPGAIDDLGREVAALGCTRVMVVCGGKTRRSKLFERGHAALGELGVALCDRVVEHSSTELVTEAAAVAARERIDGIVAIGGGSASDTAKGIAILLAEPGPIEACASRFVPPDQFFPTELPNPKIPVIAGPTTASAAEVTPGQGLRDARGRKLLFWDVKLASSLIVLDPQANVEVPVAVMATSAMNGFAHCAEGLYSRLRNPISEALALHGIRLFARALPAMVADPRDVDARAGVLTAAHLSGMVISNSRVGIHHAVCHCLGARGGLSHGVANSIMLPHALAYNLPVAAERLAAMAAAMGVDTRGLGTEQAAEAGIEAVRALQRAAGVPTRLRDAGLDRSLLPAIAEDTFGDRGLFFNPRRTTSVDAIVDLLERAW